MTYPHHPEKVAGLGQRRKVHNYRTRYLIMKALLKVMFEIEEVC